MDGFPAGPEEDTGLEELGGCGGVLPVMGWWDPFSSAAWFTHHFKRCPGVRPNVGGHKWDMSLFGKIYLRRGQSSQAGRIFSIHGLVCGFHLGLISKVTSSRSLP